ncbi:MAG: tellurite resistance TerB family protein [Campylobacterota bacterium]|nr:tellurite resistance TerB family protein [Campylobacterota bacterium]
MAGLTDLLGTLLQQGMTQSGNTRMSNTLGAGKSDDILGGLLGSLTSEKSEGGMGDLLGSLGKMMGGSQTEGKGTQASGTDIGDLLGGLLDNKAASGGIGALIGSLLGGGSGAAKGAVGGGGLGMLASLAMAALKNAGQAPSGDSNILKELAKPVEKQNLEDDAQIIVKAMINAAKADGQIDKSEIDKIIGKLDDDGLEAKEKEFFMTEANKPMNMAAVVSSANNKPEMAAQIYAASMLAIEVDTDAEKRYMHQLASGLKLDRQVVAYINRTMGVKQA